MRRLCFIVAMLAALLLSGCGGRGEMAPTPADPAESTTLPVGETDRNPTAQELGREEQVNLEIVAEGQTETVPAKLYVGQGYSIYIPIEGWRMDKDVDDGIPEETWESLGNDDVDLTVSHYSGMEEEEARKKFAAGCDYAFEDLMGGDFGDPLTGVDEEGDHLSFMSVEGYDAIYIISWEYPKSTEEGFGVRLRQIADTFELM